MTIAASSEEPPIVTLSRETLDHFKLVTKQYALFHICFFSLAFLELVVFVLFFSFFTKTTIFAFSLAALFLTGFTYFVLLFYFQAKKPQQLLDIHAYFLHHCNRIAPADSLGLIAALEQLLSTLHRQEYTYYSLPHSFQTLSPLMQKFSAWVHWKDLYKMKELILITLVQEQVKFVKEHPTDLQAHTNLANTYLSLSELYTDPRRLDSEEFHPWVAPDYSSSLFLNKRKQALLKALEEYKILNFYAPHEPWILEELAQIHCALEQPQEAIHSYETIVAKMSEDNTILFRLGILYFENGEQAKGLRLYEQLKTRQDPLAEDLITYYDKAHL